MIFITKSWGHLSSFKVWILKILKLLLKYGFSFQSGIEDINLYKAIDISWKKYGFPRYILFKIKITVCILSKNGGILSPDREILNWPCLTHKEANDLWPAKMNDLKNDTLRPSNNLANVEKDRKKFKNLTSYASANIKSRIPLLRHWTESKQLPEVYIIHWREQFRSHITTINL